ncbi:hypothetical protein J2X12_004141 [Pseudarthrobacter oxydans]|uniref:Uncharacterized protein n=1 Tax=Pseudarthrobacter oxydans TaxID=1671 RepID=A0AAW8NET8_PSEOX|nr:hypothetical protein [Pseudarthrobacter oxydans]MDR7166087.1 hypothetical protein [Pseudarthrobacter oxydans]
MSRYHVIDTKNGEVVRQYARIGSARPYRCDYRYKKRSWLERWMATEKGRLVLSVSVALLIGLSV